MKKLTLDDPRDKVLYREGSGNTVEIYDIAVMSKRGVGRGSELVRKVIDAAPEGTNLIFAITRISNTKAQKFYMHCGFRLVAGLPNFYEEEDALMYGLDL